MRAPQLQVCALPHPPRVELLAIAKFPIEISMAMSIASRNNIWLTVA
jgi:hypothetical protein